MQSESGDSLALSCISRTSGAAGCAIWLLFDEPHLAIESLHPPPRESHGPSRPDSHGPARALPRAAITSRTVFTAHFGDDPRAVPIELISPCVLACVVPEWARLGTLSLRVSAKPSRRDSGLPHKMCLGYWKFEVHA